MFKSFDLTISLLDNSEEFEGDAELPGETFNNERSISNREQVEGL